MFKNKSVAILENDISSFVTVGVPILPEAVEVIVSMSLGAAEQGGVDVCPGSGGAHGGVGVSPAKADTASTNVKTMAAPNFRSFFMFSP